MTSCKKYFITGRVQGVFFRANTQEQAQLWGITGYAKNLDDGRVEVLACGEEQALQKMEQWLHHGPDYAIVDGVEREACSTVELSGFSTL